MTKAVKYLPVFFLWTQNWVEYEPLAAVGCSNGQVQLVDVATGLVARELAVHNYAVRGIEWTQLHQFLSYAQSDSGGLGKYKPWAPRVFLRQYLLEMKSIYLFLLW